MYTYIYIYIYIWVTPPLLFQRRLHYGIYNIPYYFLYCFFLVSKVFVVMMFISLVIFNGVLVICSALISKDYLVIYIFFF